MELKIREQKYKLLIFADDLAIFPLLSKDKTDTLE